MGYRLPRYVYPLSLIGTLAGGVVLIREYVGGRIYSGKESMIGKTVIVTGANTGIGKAAAIELARRGARVILACRDEEKATKARAEIVLETANRNVVVRKLDLASLDSIKQFAQNIVNSENHLDVLINNAGVMRCPRKLTKEGFELQLGVNHLGHFYLTNLLLDKLVSSQPSRIVTVSSIAHKRGEIDFSDLNSVERYDPALAYSQSKLANLLFTKELSERLKGTGVTTYAVHPGIVNTEIARHMSIAKSYFSYIFLGPFLWLFTKTPRQGAQTILYCACSNDVVNESGKYYHDCQEQEPSDAAKEPAMAKRLWAISEKWTQLK